MTVQITLSDTHTAITEASNSKFKPEMPVIVVFENGRRTPGQWYADTIAESTSDEIFIDFGQGWKLDKNETALLKGFAMGVQRAAELAATPRHTVRGQTSDTGWEYGTKHDIDCPACLADGSDFLTSPRSETYWAS